MIEAKTSFWQTQEARGNVGAESLVKKISPEEAFAFSLGCSQIYQAVESVNPDVVFLPERGAGPISWALEAFEAIGGRSFYKVPLIIGTETDIKTGSQGGQTKPVKQLNVERGVEIAIANVGLISKPMLIDEVQFGGTIRQATHYLHRALSDHGITSPLNLVAVEDTREGGWVNKKTGGYRTMVSNRRGHVSAQVVRMPVFSIDREVFLNNLLTERDRNSRIPPMPMIIHNTDAQEIVKNLINGFISPDILIDALVVLGTNSNQGQSYRSAKAIEWIRNILSSSDDPSFQRRILSWLTKYASLSKEFETIQKTS